jgi:hypothetical protein
MAEANAKRQKSAHRYPGARNPGIRRVLVTGASGPYSHATHHSQLYRSCVPFSAAAR